MMEEMKKKMRTEEGFTLAELLIVVAIIAVLVAIAIPVFSAQLEKSKESTDMANIRAAYATLVAQYLENNTANSINVPAKQSVEGWQNTGINVLETMVSGTVVPVTVDAKITGNYTVAIDANGNITVS